MIEPDDFIARVWREGAQHQRNNLPWRCVDDAYAVLVSEVMLQQTQVVRVLKYWNAFLALFPTLDALAAADTACVLEQWQGLGYNRRALALKRAADICAAEHAGKLPRGIDALMALPGIGPATAAGVCSFAYNEPSVYLETNVRTVFLHEFFPEEQGVSDKELYPLVQITCSQDNPRGWYYALLDYGAHLKATQVNPSRKSAHHTRQSSYVGSRRQKRAEALRCVLANPGISDGELFAHLEAFEHAGKREQLDYQAYRSVVDGMVAEGFFRCEAGGYCA
ncbi:MAG: adenine glycosylase [Raoultibacter sp.]